MGGGYVSGQLTGSLDYNNDALYVQCQINGTWVQFGDTVTPTSPVSPFNKTVTRGIHLTSSSDPRTVRSANDAASTPPPGRLPVHLTVASGTPPPLLSSPHQQPQVIMLVLL